MPAVHDVASDLACDYERDPYLTMIETDVTSVGLDDGRPFAILSRTILYPEGGGQPADRGWLGKVAVLDVQRMNDEIRHFLAAPVAVGPVELRVDWERRFDHMQQHTAQHLLTAVAADRHGWRTTAFHLGATMSDIELDVPSIAAIEIGDLEDALVDAVAEALAAHPATVVARHFEQGGMAFLQKVGRRPHDRAPAKVALLQEWCGARGLEHNQLAS